MDEGVFTKVYHGSVPEDQSLKMLLQPEGPNTQYLRSLVPNTVKGMASGTRGLKYWVLGPSRTGKLEWVTRSCGPELPFVATPRVPVPSQPHVLAVLRPAPGATK